MYLVDSFYNLKDSDFIDKIKADLQNFIQSNKNTEQSGKVLLLPKFDYHHRYLIHQIVQSIFYEDLFSFSLGNKNNRRLFVCSKQLSINHDALLKDSKMTTNEQNKVLIESKSDNIEATFGASTRQTSSNRVNNNKSKRPSQHFYVPKARRSDLNEEITESTSVDALTSTLDKALNLNTTVAPSTISSTDVIKESTSTVSTENGTKEEEEVDSWDALYDDSGECKNKKLLKELNTVIQDNIELDVEQLSAEDYAKWLEKDVDLDENEFSHVIEIYDFPTEFKNEHIFNVFKDTLKHSNFDIKWVDDTHCLGIFATTQAANEALRVHNALLKTRPIVHATEESKRKAQKCVQNLKPYKARPVTTSFVATKLIGASLGLGNLLLTNKANEEKKKLQDARDKRRKEKQQQEAIWNGDV